MGFEPTPLRTGALSQRLRPLGQTVSFISLFPCISLLIIVFETLNVKYQDNEAKELMDKFILICKSFCAKKKEIKSKFDKLTPDNAENNN